MQMQARATLLLAVLLMLWTFTNGFDSTVATKAMRSNKQFVCNDGRYEEVECLNWWLNQDLLTPDELDVMYNDSGHIAWNHDRCSNFCRSKFLTCSNFCLIESDVIMKGLNLGKTVKRVFCKETGSGPVFGCGGERKRHRPSRNNTE